jgi:hypothetical protein
LVSRASFLAAVTRGNRANVLNKNFLRFMIWGLKSEIKLLYWE